MLGNIFILGDSYSTFRGYIPEEYRFYYSEEGPNYLTAMPDTGIGPNDVCKAEHTWWYNLTRENGTLVRNCSFSGTTICHTGYSKRDDSDISFVTRFQRLLDGGFFKENKIDTFFLFGGTNDSWAGSPLGVEVLSDWKKEDLYNVFPAFSYLVHTIVHNLKGTKLYCIINTELKEEIAQFFARFCHENGAQVIELHDIDKVHGHPTIEGMKQIKEQVMAYIEQKQR